MLVAAAFICFVGTNWFFQIEHKRILCWIYLKFDYHLVFNGLEYRRTYQFSQMLGIKIYSNRNPKRVPKIINFIQLVMNVQTQENVILNRLLWHLKYSKLIIFWWSAIITSGFFRSIHQRKRNTSQVIQSSSTKSSLIPSGTFELFTTIRPFFHFWCFLQ